MHLCCLNSKIGWKRILVGKFSLIPRTLATTAKMTMVNILVYQQLYCVKETLFPNILYVDVAERKERRDKRDEKSDREKTEEEKARDMIKKAKVEDDEYKTEEQTYYRYTVYSTFNMPLFFFFASLPRGFITIYVNLLLLFQYCSHGP